MKHKIILQILFLILLFPLVVHAEKIPDYYSPYAPILLDKQVYAWTDKVYITIIAPSWNENTYGIDSIGDYEGHFIKISTTSHELEPYKLVETEPNSGTFTGEITLTGFSHDVNGDGQADTFPRTGGSGPSNGFLETDRDDGLTISFEFADGVVLTESAKISWTQADASFDRTRYLPDESAKIKIIDPDMNLNPESSDTIFVDVSSDSDSAGITVDAIETNQSSGIFEAEISFTPTDTSSGKRLHALQNDMIYARYEDRTLPSPYSKNDSIDVIAKSLITTDTIPRKVEYEKLVITDNTGTTLKESQTVKQLQVITEIQNNQSSDQPFVYLVQIKNSSGVVVSLSWLEGSLAIGQKFQVSQSWNPTEPGIYDVEAFVWNSFENTSPLGFPITAVYKITQ